MDQEVGKLEFSPVIIDVNHQVSKQCVCVCDLHLQDLYENWDPKRQDHLGHNENQQEFVQTLGKDKKV